MGMVLNNLTAVTVHCNTLELLHKSVTSIGHFYPDLPIKVIENSIVNKGHGPGMHEGIMTAESDFVLLFDTDIVMKKPCLEKMMELFGKDTFGVGEVNLEDQEIYRIKFGSGTKKIPVLHPYFHIVQKKVYQKFLPYVQNGGPVFLTALDIFSQGLSDRILKNFPVRDYVEHRWRGTRDINPPDMFKNSVVLNKEYVERFAENWRKTCTK